MALFGRTRIDDPQLARAVGGRRVLAAGRSDLGEVLGLAESLVYADSTGVHEVPWHEVEHGGWDGRSRTLRWTTLGGGEGALELTEVGGLSDFFNERVQASIACTRSVSLEGTGTAVITARRNLGDSRTGLIWRVSPGKGVRAEQVDADPLVALELSRLRAEYDVG